MRAPLDRPSSCNRRYSLLVVVDLVGANASDSECEDAEQRRQRLTYVLAPRLYGEGEDEERETEQEDRNDREIGGLDFF
jgi:hypothetical protein